MFMKETGRMIRLLDMEFIHIQMEQCIKEIGLEISKRDMELRLGLMERTMKEIINKDRKKVLIFILNLFKIGKGTFSWGDGS